MRRRVNTSSTYLHKSIEVCAGWQSYATFYTDMSERPPNTSIDRIDNTKRYTSENCRWADMRTQQNNKDDLTEIQFNGETLTIGQWINKLGLNWKQRNTVHKRHATYGAKTFEELFTPNRLQNLRISKRENLCLDCGTDKTCKWRKYGKQCNTCWHKKYRLCSIT